jgi:hypothetical protein
VPQEARDQERQPTPVSPAPAVAPIEAPVAMPQPQAAGPVPAVMPVAGGGERAQSASELAYAATPQTGGPEIEATDQALGQHMVEGMNKANSGGTFDSGVHYWYNYKRICDRQGADVWKDEWRAGHTRATQFVNPHEKGRWMDFELKKGESASKGIKAWLAGATVCECLSAVVAMEIDSLRAAIGDTQFDAMFGSDDPKVDANVRDDRRMHIRAGLAGTPVGDYVKPTSIAQKARRGEAISEKDLETDLVPGHWYYFYNHPKYLLKHPGGAWQGENALYMGKNAAGERLWAGMGADGKTEDTMIDEMVSAYNQPRNDYDTRVMKESGYLADDGTYADKRYDPASGEFPDTVTRKDILEAPAYELGGRVRKGGFKPDAGKALDAAAVKRTRP